MGQAFHWYGDIGLDFGPGGRELFLERIDQMQRTRYGGTLLNFDHMNLDPWIAAALILQHTEVGFTPLVAVQPHAFPPFTVAKFIHHFACAYRRRVDINLIIGSNEQYFSQVGDSLPKEKRYDRLVEFAAVLRLMLSSDELITFEGEYYRYNGLRTYTRIPLEMMPRFFVASATASSSGLEAASKVADVALTFPLESDVLPMRFIEPLQESGLATGLRFKIVARSTGVEAHQAASEADPYYKLRIIAKRAYNSRDKVHKVFYPALMGIKTDCPVFIGSYEEVSAYLSGYVRSGVRNVILAPMELNMEHAEYTMNMVLEACGMG